MHPPSHVCEALYRLSPSLRLAWRGRGPESVEESDSLNLGHFVVLELIPARGVFIEDPGSLMSFWGVESRMDGYGDVTFHREDCGVVFGRDGSPGQDWNSDQFHAIYSFHCDGTMTDYEGAKIDESTVRSGKIVRVCESFLGSAKEEIKERRREELRDWQRNNQDMGREWADRAIFESRGTSDNMGSVVKDEEYHNTINSKIERRERNAANLYERFGVG